MKPAPFEYIRPQSLAEACELLAGDEDARAIAGGQTLVPMLAMRLARPTKLIDIMRLARACGHSHRGRRASRRRDNAASHCRTRPADPCPSACAGARAAMGRSSANAQSRHGRRFDRQCGSVCGNSVGCRHARRRDHAGDAGRPVVDAGRRLFHRSDADHDRAGRMRECRKVSGLGAQSASASGFFEVSARRSDFAFVQRWRRSRSMRTGAVSLSRSASVASAIARCGWMCRRCSAQGSMRRPSRKPSMRVASDMDAIERSACQCILSPSRRHHAWQARPRTGKDRSRRPRAEGSGMMKVELRVNGVSRDGRCRAAQDAARYAAREFPAQRHPCRLRARRLRRLHRAGRRRAGAVLPDVRRAGRRLRDHHDRRSRAGARANSASSRMRSAKPTACSAATARRA